MKKKSRLGLEPKRDWNELLAISTAPHQPPVQHFAKIEYSLIRWVIKLSRQAQVSSSDQWDLFFHIWSIHSFIIRFPYPVAHVDFDRKSDTRTSQFKVIDDPWTKSYKLSSITLYGINIFIYRLMNKIVQFCFAVQPLFQRQNKSEHHFIRT